MLEQLACLLIWEQTGYPCANPDKQVLQINIFLGRTMFHRGPRVQIEDAKVERQRQSTVFPPEPFCQGCPPTPLSSSNHQQ